METRFFEVDAKMEELKQRHGRFINGSNWIVQDFYEKLDISWIYHDNALEGVVLSYSELKAAIDKNIISDVTLIPMYEEIKNHKAAIEHIRTLAHRRKQPITLDTLRRLYEILSPEAVGKPSQYRKDNPLHRLYYHEIAPPDKIGQRMRKLVEWLDSDEFRDEHPVKRAARTHYRLLAIYPWTKNSGKVARLLMNLLLLRDGYLPAVVHAIERQRYYEVMRNENAGIVQLIVESLDNGIETALKFFSEVEEARRASRGAA
ncbi:MAG TPA: Fic family protein [Polyangia bacterium]|nr:Fic family protein [Polyangia bacterium]